MGTAARGSFCSSRRNAARGSSATVTGSRDVTVADRGAPSIRASSPNDSPGPSVLDEPSRASTRTRPASSRKKLLPLASWRTTVRPFPYCLTAKRRAT